MTAMKRSQTSDFYSRKPANFFDEEHERQQRRPIPTSSSSHSMNEPRFSTNSSTSRTGAPSNPSGASSNPFDGEPDDEVDELRSIQTRIQQSKDSQLDSQRRALKAIYESEQLGTGTAEELSRQGEKLDNVEHKLDGMNSTLNQTQRNLNNIKSIFGGVKNWWSGKKEAPKPTVGGAKPASPVPGSSPNGPTAGGKDMRNHPAMGLRDGSRSDGMAMPEDPYERETIDNLDEMSSGLGRLKHLALGLGDELERQNSQIERITHKSEVVKPKIDDQNRQMKQLLK
jgi:synaptosomal-associated protein 29